MTSASQAGPSAVKRGGNPFLVVAGSTFGTLFEWYDFFIYGALVAQITKHFFSGLNETTGYIFALAGFAIGFLFRPLGALVFGRIGDRFGRKNTFLATLAIMGAATFLIGLIPNYDAIGIAAPLALIGLRILQGLAIGGEYGGAITYVAEHAPPERRGLHTSFLGASAVAGLLLSLLVIAVVRAQIGAEAFEAHGWRAPFLLSAVLLIISLWVRTQLHESPIFGRLKQENTTSKSPLTESFLRWSNLKLVLIALAAVIGQAVVFYSATFYALYFLQKAARLDSLATSLVLAGPLLVAIPLFVLGGWLADKFGRKPLVLVSYALAALLFFPLFNGLLASANPPLARAHSDAPITASVDARSCSLQFDPIGRNAFDRTSCDVALSFLASMGATYRISPAAPGAVARILVGQDAIEAPAPHMLASADKAARISAFRDRASAVLADHGYRPVADPAAIHVLPTVLILTTLLFIASLCAGAISPMLAEIFPTRLRYSSLGIPQNIGNGWFGGFLPTTAFAIVAATGDIYAGLWYPIALAAAAFAICLLFLPETRGRSLE